MVLVFDKFPSHLLMLAFVIKREIGLPGILGAARLGETPGNLKIELWKH